jgi:hypothetical protein
VTRAETIRIVHVDEAVTIVVLAIAARVLVALTRRGDALMRRTVTRRRSTVRWGTRASLGAPEGSLGADQRVALACREQREHEEH